MNRGQAHGAVPPTTLFFQFKQTLPRATRLFGPPRAQRNSIFRTDQAMKITVILCTYNRAHSISMALESVLASVLPPDVEWEVLVVDNNSKDQTRAVANEFCIRHPGRVRYLFEEHQGLSNARNAGIREARGEIIAFTDDDVTVDSTWLQNLTAS